MSESTITNPSPSGYFDLTAFGATEISKPVTSKVTTPVPPGLVTAFTEMVTYFSGHTNRHYLPYNASDAATADQFRGWVQQFADDHNLTATMPRFVPAHTTKDKIDPKTGKVTPGHKVEANKIDPTWNVPGSTDVHFRFAPKGTKKSKNGAVTVTQIAPAGAAK